MRTAGLRLAALLGAAFLMSCGDVPDHANVRVQNDSSSPVSVVLTNTGGGTVSINAVAPGTMSEFVDLPLGAWTVGSATVTGATFTAVGTDNYTLLVAGGSVTVKRE
ncbi:MAG: hypothetical protein V4558_09525 [Gemmatimonadota bacterium]